jgi:hypothetical protein
MSLRQVLTCVPAGLVAAGVGGLAGYRFTSSMELHDLTANQYQKISTTPSGDVYRKRPHSANVTTWLEVAAGTALAGVGWATLHVHANGLALNSLRDAGSGVLMGGGAALGVGALFANELYTGGEIHA